MITGSHNPPEYNGFKMMSGQDTLYGETIQEICRIIEDGRVLRATPEGRRSAYDHRPGIPGLRRRPASSSSGRLKVVIDAGNGTGGVVAVPDLQEAGLRGDRALLRDGRPFPQPPSRSDPARSHGGPDRQGQRDREADFGIAYDGDADRIGVVDDAGHLIWGDQLLIFFARDILKANPGAAIISEVKATKVLYDEIARLGRQADHVEDRPFADQEKDQGGEGPAGRRDERPHVLRRPLVRIRRRHLFLGPAGSSSSPAPRSKLSEMLAGLPKTFSTPEIRIYASEEVKFKIVDEVRAELAAKYPVIDIDGVRAVYPKGWGLVRASNTQAVLVLRFEAETDGRSRGHPDGSQGRGRAGDPEAGPDEDRRDPISRPSSWPAAAGRASGRSAAQARPSNSFRSSADRTMIEETVRRILPLVPTAASTPSPTRAQTRTIRRLLPRLPDAERPGRAAGQEHGAVAHPGHGLGLSRESPTRWSSSCLPII